MRLTQMVAQLTLALWAWSAPLPEAGAIAPAGAVPPAPPDVAAAGVQVAAAVADGEVLQAAITEEVAAARLALADLLSMPAAEVLPPERLRVQIVPGGQDAAGGGASAPAEMRQGTIWVQADHPAMADAEYRPSLILHELTHVALELRREAAGGEALPAWFHEGVAVWAEVQAGPLGTRLDAFYRRWLQARLPLPLDAIAGRVAWDTRYADDTQRYDAYATAYLAVATLVAGHPPRTLLDVAGQPPAEVHAAPSERSADRTHQLGWLSGDLPWGRVLSLSAPWAPFGRPQQLAAPAGDSSFAAALAAAFGSAAADLDAQLRDAVGRAP